MRVFIIMLLSLGIAYAGAKEEVEKELFECAVEDAARWLKALERIKVFYAKDACTRCARTLYDEYDFADEHEKKRFVAQFRRDYSKECDKDLIKRIYQAAKEKIGAK